EVAKQVAQFRVGLERERILAFGAVERDGRHLACQRPEKVLRLVAAEIQACGPEPVSGLHLGYLFRIVHDQPASVSPPLTLSTCPVTKSEPGVAKNRIASATSCGLPRRWNGIALMKASRNFSGTACMSGVSVGPGQ